MLFHVRLWTAAAGIPEGSPRRAPKKQAAADEKGHGEWLEPTYRKRLTTWSAPSQLGRALTDSSPGSSINPGQRAKLEMWCEPVSSVAGTAEA